VTGFSEATKKRSWAEAQPSKGGDGRTKIWKKKNSEESLEEERILGKGRKSKEGKGRKGRRRRSEEGEGKGEGEGEGEGDGEGRGEKKGEWKEGAKERNGKKEKGKSGRSEGSAEILWRYSSEKKPGVVPSGRTSAKEVSQTTAHLVDPGGSVGREKKDRRGRTE
jgi:hypothetical protein